MILEPVAPACLVSTHARGPSFLSFRTRPNPNRHKPLPGGPQIGGRLLDDILLGVGLQRLNPKRNYLHLESYR